MVLHWFLLCCFEVSTDHRFCPVKGYGDVGVHVVSIVRTDVWHYKEHLRDTLWQIFGTVPEVSRHNGICGIFRVLQ